MLYQTSIYSLSNQLDNFKRKSGLTYSGKIKNHSQMSPSPARGGPGRGQSGVGLSVGVSVIVFELG
jgi:hypothetical protein